MLTFKVGYLVVERSQGLIQLPSGINAWLRAAKESVCLLFGLGNR